MRGLWRFLSHALRTPLVVGTSGVRRSAFADAVHVGAGESDVVAGQSGEFGGPQPGLDGQGEHGVVAPTGPGRLVAGCEQRIDLGFGEIGDQASVGLLGCDRELALDRRGMLGMAQGEVTEQRVDRREAVVTGGGPAVPVTLEVVEEGGDRPGDPRLLLSATKRRR